MLTNLSASALRMLRLLSKGRRIYHIGSPTCMALERRGLIASTLVAAETPSKEYAITEAGRAALQEDGR